MKSASWMYADQGNEQPQASAQAIAQACGDVLPREECLEIAEREPQDALCHALHLLLMSGVVPDPEKHLHEQGILSHHSDSMEDCFQRR